MSVLTLSEVKANLGKLIDDIVTRDEEIIITKNGKPSAVLTSMNEYDASCLSRNFIKYN